MPVIPKSECKPACTGTVDQKASDKLVQNHYQGMVAATLMMSAPGKHVSTDAETKEQLNFGPVSLYASIKPKNPLDSVLTALLISVNSLALDTLGHAAISPPGDKLREVNMRLGLKGATVAIDLINTIDKRGRNKTEKVIVTDKVIDRQGEW